MTQLCTDVWLQTLGPNNRRAVRRAVVTLAEAITGPREQDLSTVTELPIIGMRDRHAVPESLPRSRTRCADCGRAGVHRQAHGMGVTTVAPAKA